MVTQLQGHRVPSADTLRRHVQSVRLFMRDFPELNLFLRGEESDDRQIEFATMDFLSDFNGTPPMSRYTLDDLMSYELASFAVRGTVISLLESLMIIYSRNHLPFSDGGMTVAINDKAPMIQSMLGLFRASYEQKLRMIKTQLNVAQLLGTGAGGVASEYSVMYTSVYY